MRSPRRKLQQAFTFLMFLLISITDSLAAEAKTVFEPVHWAYSSFFGTGWYQVEDTRSVFVVKAPIRQTLRTSSLTESGSRKLGVEIRYPVTVGLHDIEDLGGIIE
ncbi:MAG: hypothetical protein WBN06_16660, partial [Lysobacterales bacterium]